MAAIKHLNAPVLVCAGCKARLAIPSTQARAWKAEHAACAEPAAVARAAPRPFMFVTPRG